MCSGGHTLKFPHPSSGFRPRLNGSRNSIGRHEGTRQEIRMRAWRNDRKRQCVNMYSFRSPGIPRAETRCKIDSVETTPASAI